MVKLSWIVFLPLLASVINGLWVLIAARSNHIPRRLPISIIANVAAFASFFYALAAFFHLLGLPPSERIVFEQVYEWIQVGSLNISFSLQLDPLSAVMALVVTGVGSLIHLYSIGYMAKDPGQGRYFVYLNLFLAAMLLLVLADNLVLLFVGWEGVGLCSYLLIGFWFSDEAKARAGKKAFIVNRIGDLAFLIGIFWIFTSLGSVHFQGMEEALNQYTTAPSFLFWICLLLFIGACGKSAQFPLHIWLPDAMAGPTPVSALIHAATMVTAGVYLVARLSFLYVFVPSVGLIIAGVGVFTALMAALIALTQNDIKKVLAYSTISQLGYMFLAVGVGAYGVGIFHLVTHAFFKGLLFLGAGSVIHALSNEQNIQKMGGIAKKIPITFYTFLIGSIALIGLPPLSGFFSKDEILWKALEGGHVYLYGIGLLVSFLTAFYMTRLLYLTFWGECRVDEKVKENIHESPLSMTIPLVILAFFSVLAGFWGLPHFITKFFGVNLLGNFLSFLSTQGPYQKVMSHPPFGEFSASAIAVLVASLGIGVAFFLYAKKPGVLRRLSEIRPIYALLSNKFYFDEIYQKLIIEPVRWISINGLWKGLDVSVIDRFVNGIGKFIARIGIELRHTQTGKVRNYVLSMAFGLAVLIGFVIFWRV